MASAVRRVSWHAVGPAGDDDHLGGLARLLQLQGLLDRDLAEGIHRHLHVRELDAALVRLDADLHVEVDHAFHGYEDFHRWGSRCAEIQTSV
jgi:hypothetical protein